MASLTVEPMTLGVMTRPWTKPNGELRETGVIETEGRGLWECTHDSHKTMDEAKTCARKELKAVLARSIENL